MLGVADSRVALSLSPDQREQQVRSSTSSSCELGDITSNLTKARAPGVALVIYRPVEPSPLAVRAVDRRQRLVRRAHEVMSLEETLTYLLPELTQQETFDRLPLPRRQPLTGGFGLGRDPSRDNRQRLTAGVVSDEDQLDAVLLVVDNVVTTRRDRRPADATGSGSCCRSPA